MIPASVLVGSHVYSLEEMAKVHKDNRMGECHVGDLQIKIRANLAPQKKQEVVLHELLHACWDAAGLDMIEKTVTEEQAVDRLAYVLLGVLRANPVLISYLTEA